MRMRREDASGVRGNGQGSSEKRKMFKVSGCGVGVRAGVGVGVMCMCVFFMPHVLVSCPRKFVGCRGWHNILTQRFVKHDIPVGIQYCKTNLPVHDVKKGGL